MASQRLSGIRAASGLPNDYPTYRSPYGPKYKVQPHIQGWTIKQATRLGVTLGGFGASLGFFAFYFLSDAPRFRRDIMQRIPVIGTTYIREIPASDNPF